MKLVWDGTPGRTTWNGNEGMGEPEPLEHGFQGYWSRRVTDEHRLIHTIVDDELRIAACRYHGER